MTERKRSPQTHSPAAGLPWSVPVMVARIPDAGLQVAFEADAAQRAALAKLAGLREVLHASASFELSHSGNEAVHAVGRVRGRVGQTCVVTLEPVEADIDEAIDVMFVPASQGTSATYAPPPIEGDEDIPEPPEPIIGGMIDLGKLAMDMLFLGIDPYPRQPGTVFVAPAIPDDPDKHPFAALKTLKTGGDPAGKKLKDD